MGMYNGNGMAVSGTYCIHYGRKGMKWGKNIFGDIVNGFNRGVNATTSAYAEAKRQSNGGYASYGKMYGGTNRSYANMPNTAGNRTRLQGINGTTYGATTAKVATKVGNFVGTTAYNATVFAKRASAKISEVATKSWSEAKRIGSAAISKGKELLGKLFEGAKSMFNSAKETASKTFSDAKMAGAKTIDKLTGAGKKAERNQSAREAYEKRNGTSSTSRNRARANAAVNANPSKSAAIGKIVTNQNASAAAAKKKQNSQLRVGASGTDLRKYRGAGRGH